MEEVGVVDDDQVALITIGECKGPGVFPPEGKNITIIEMKGVRAVDGVITAGVDVVGGGALSGIENLTERGGLPE